MKAIIIEQNDDVEYHVDEISFDGIMLLVEREKYEYFRHHEVKIVDMEDELFNAELFDFPSDECDESYHQKYKDKISGLKHQIEYHINKNYNYEEK